MKNLRIAYCPKCYKAVMLCNIHEDIPQCCGREMKVLPAQTQGNGEATHLPVIARKDGHLFAYAGSYEHPMDPDHYIAWMVLETEKNARICMFQPGEEPKAAFLPGEAVIAVYAFCTKHGLWKTEI
ncbi:MAG: desulfoferrodoxin [Solobacterium sp.]|nr:desulfoferrodoxin [Solobacterium sp.]